MTSLIVLFLLFCFPLTTSRCTLTFRQKPKCVFYRYSDPRCRMGEEESTCTVLRVTFNELFCHQYKCVSHHLNIMCYSRESFCSCCCTFIKILTINYCTNKSTICSKKSIYPKLIEKCQFCSNCSYQCCPVFQFPRKWRQPKLDYVYGFKKDKVKNRFFVDVKTESRFKSY